MTLNNNLDRIMLPLKTCSFMRYTCTLNIKCLPLLDQKSWPKLYIWPLTLKNDLDLVMLPLKMCSPSEIHMYTKYQMSIFIGSNVMANVTYILTFDLEGWPWPWNVRLHEIHIFAKYQVSICNGSKVMAIVKVVWPKLYIWS